MTTQPGVAMIGVSPRVDHDVSRAVDHDSAFAPLLEHCGRLANIAYRVLGDGDRALAAVERAYQHAYVDCGELDGQLPPFAWLCRITLHQCAEVARTKPRRERAAACTGGAGATSADVPRLTWTALSGLPARYRDPLVLYCYERMSYSEIGQVLGCDADSAKSRVARAQQVLESRIPAQLWARTA